MSNSSSSGSKTPDSPLSQAFPGESNPLVQLATLLTDYQIASAKADRLVDYHSRNALKARLNLADGKTGDMGELFEWIEKYLQYSVRSNHPGFVNRMWAEANLPSVMAEMVTAVAQTSACTFESAPVAVLIEQFMFETILALVGFENGEAQMTTGSSNANMIAMLCARNRTSETIKRNGLEQSAPLTAYVSADAHYSLDKAANVLGIGTANLKKIPFNDAGEMDPIALEQELELAQQQDRLPFFVCATAGTTVRGAYDPIEPLLALREKYGFWLHVDAAWGGGVLLDEQLRSEFLPGIEQVNSLTWDFHKMLGTALMCNVLLINSKKQQLLSSCGAGDGSYLFREQDEDPQEMLSDPGTSSLQCGRRVDALKWFLDWKFYGQHGLAQKVHRALELTSLAEDIVVTTPELELMAPRRSFNLCFRYAPSGQHDLNQLNQTLRTTLYQRGISLVGIAWFDDDLVLRWVGSNSALSRDNIRQFFNTVIDTGKEIIATKSAS